MVLATEVISDGAEGIILESVLEGYAEYYSADLSEKVIRGMTDNALKCKYNGGTIPIGYVIDEDQHFQLDPLTSPYILEAFKRYDEGATMTEIRDWINAKGVKNIRGQALTYNSVHHYYKCVTLKKKRGGCHKKTVRKQWIEDLVVNATMEILNDDHAIEAIVSMLMDLQDRENINLPLYEQQLSEVNVDINNLINAIQQGILTKSTKARLEELENSRDELENKIALEKLAKPKVSSEFMTFWLHRFCKLDVTKKEHRQMLIDAFINAIFLYDDKMLITFNYKEGTKTITFDDVKREVPDGASGSDLDCCGAPYRKPPLTGICLLEAVFLFVLCEFYLEIDDFCNALL